MLLLESTAFVGVPSENPSDFPEETPYELYIGINVIENYLIGWIFTFGLVGTIPLFLVVYVPLTYFAMTGNLIERMSVFSFAVISITNNSLTTKTPTLLLLFTCLYLSKSLREKLSAPQNSQLNSGYSHA